AVLDQDEDLGPRGIGRHCARWREWIADPAYRRLIGGDAGNAAEQAFDLLRLRVGLGQRRVLWHGDGDGKVWARRLIEQVDAKQRDTRHRHKEHQTGASDRYDAVAVHPAEHRFIVLYLTVDMFS